MYTNDQLKAAAIAVGIMVLLMFILYAAEVFPAQSYNYKVHNQSDMDVAVCVVDPVAFLATGEMIYERKLLPTQVEYIMLPKGDYVVITMWKEEGSKHIHSTMFHVSIPEQTGCDIHIKGDKK